MPGDNDNPLLSLQAFAAEELVRSTTPPPGWAPGLVWDGSRGTLTTGTLNSPPTDWGPLLAARGLDPEVYEIVGDTIKWCSYDGWKRDVQGEDAYSAICYSYRAEIRLKRQDRPDLEELFAEVRRLKAGGQIGEIILAGMGDLVEGCTGFYPSQPWLTELDRREQTRVVRRGLLDIIRTVAPLAERITVTAVAGNHGENRQSGKRITGYGDNDDVAVFEQVAEICAENPEVFSHVGFRLPADRIAVALETAGQTIAFTHGHLARPKSDPAATLWEWWRGQAMGREYEGVADAQILCSGHYHHTNLRSQQGRTLLIAPSLTAVGDWWANSTGMRTDPGTLTFVVDQAGWTDLEVLR